MTSLQRLDYSLVRDLGGVGLGLPKSAKHAKISLSYACALFHARLSFRLSIT